MALGLTPQEIVDKDEYPLLSKANHWERVAISDVAIVQNGFAFKSALFNRYEGMPLIRIRDISRTETEHRYTGEYSLEYVVHAGDILIGMDGDFAAAKWQGECALLNQRVCRLSISSQHIDERFFFLCLQPFLNAINAETSSVTVKHLSSKTISEIPLPLPPLNEQKRIVAKIEELFSELDNGIAALKTAREQLKVYRQAVLKHAFEGNLTAKWREENADKLESPEQLIERIQQERENRYQQQLEDWKATVKAWEASGKEGKKPGKPKKYKPTPLEKELAESISPIPSGWKWVSFSELLYSIRGGTTVPPIDTPTSLPILRSSSIRAGRLNLEDIRYLPEDSKISDEDYLNFSDLLFSRLNGTLEFVGVCASVPVAIPQNLLYPDRLYCAKLIDPEMAKFCEHYFSNPVIRRNIEKKAKSTAGHKRISIPDVSEQPIPIFNKAEILELVNSLSEKFSFVDKLQEEIEKSLLDSEILRQSILKKAFSGQLVPQDPNDEPASELLARIQAEKAEQQVAAKVKSAGKSGAKRGRKSKVAT